MDTIDEIDLLYCPRCSRRFERGSKLYLHCPACSLHYYVNPRPCNAIIIQDDDRRILLVKRKEDPYQGMWDLPGGFVDVGETLETSVYREAKEELTVEIDDLRYLFSTVDRYVYRGLRYHTLCFFFRVSIRSGSLSARDDVVSYALFHEQDIPWKDVGFESVKQGLRTYLTPTSGTFSQSQESIDPK